MLLTLLGSGSGAPLAVTGTLAATEAGADTAALSGQVIVQSTLAATEAGADTAALVGQVIVQGTFAATEAGSDIAALSGGSSIAGSLAATESGADTAVLPGQVIVQGTLDAAEAGADTAALAGEAAAPRLYFVIGPSSGWATPSASEIKLGQLSGGGAATAAGNDAAPTSTTIYDFAAAAGLTPGPNYRVAFVWSDGARDSNVNVSVAFAFASTVGRPASDTSNSGWTASTGSDLYAMLDEVTPDAADYIVATSVGAVCELALTTTGYPGTASQVLKFRASSSTGNSVIVRLRNTGGATVRSQTQLLTATDTEYSIGLTAGEIAAITSGALSVQLESA